MVVKWPNAKVVSFFSEQTLIQETSKGHSLGIQMSQQFKIESNFTDLEGNNFWTLLWKHFQCALKLSQFSWAGRECVL